MAKTIQEKLIKKLQKLEEYISAYQENKDILVSFIEKYIECEICYKALLLAYLGGSTGHILEMRNEVRFCGWLV